MSNEKRDDQEWMVVARTLSVIKVTPTGNTVVSREGYSYNPSLNRLELAFSSTSIVVDNYPPPQ